MAGSLNKVLLIVLIGADPEIKQMVNGKSVARLSLATSQSWKDKNTGEWNFDELANNFDEQKYYVMLDEVFKHTQQHLTTKSLAEYILEKV